MSQHLHHNKAIFSSIGFSGAGFLACYHLGVAKCLLDQGRLAVVSPSSQQCQRHQRDDLRTAQQQQRGRHHRSQHHGNDDDTKSLTSTPTPTTPTTTTLVGVSGGALVASALVMGVDPADEGMQVLLDVNDAAVRAGGLLNTLQPGFSLIDVVERYLLTIFKKKTTMHHDAVNDDNDEVVGRFDGLRIGLTDRRKMGFRVPGHHGGVRNDNAETAFCYVDRFRCVEDVVAACVLSSYVPGITGPILGRHDTRPGLGAVHRASARLYDMIEAGCVKDGTTGRPIQRVDDERGAGSGREICWDGGLVNAFPYIDEQTIIVSPIAATFHHNDSINPSIEYHGRSGGGATAADNDADIIRTWPLDDRVAIHLTRANAMTFRTIALSSEPAILEERFAQGYDHASTFLDQHNLLSIYKTSASSSRNNSKTAGATQVSSSSS